MGGSRSAGALTSPRSSQKKPAAQAAFGSCSPRSGAWELGGTGSAAARVNRDAHVAEIAYRLGRSSPPAGGAPRSSRSAPRASPPPGRPADESFPLGGGAAAANPDASGGASSGQGGGAQLPEVRLLMDQGNYISPGEIHRSLLAPIGISGTLAVVAVGPCESRIVCRTWGEAYRVLNFCTAELQRRLGVRVRPAVVGGVAMTRTQLARLANTEPPLAPHPHALRQTQ
jgi:hypothetical protein